ncbi:hypothetical protein KBD87_01785 [Candidatus Saccharibacteria bacterium]|nr:hypothetical protein [Candidatus Saccharibacteria bacterium]
MKNFNTFKILTLLGVFWILPINRLYIGVKRGLFLRVITFNYLWLGAIYDCFAIGKIFNEAVPKPKTVNNNELYRMAEKLDKVADDLDKTIDDLPNDNVKLRVDID